MTEHKMLREVYVFILRFKVPEEKNTIFLLLSFLLLFLWFGLVSNNCIHISEKASLFQIPLNQTLSELIYSYINNL